MQSRSKVSIRTYIPNRGSDLCPARIKIWQLDESTGNWSVEDDWKVGRSTVLPYTKSQLTTIPHSQAHDAAVSKVSWAHPEFGSIIASSSFDRTVKIWEQSPVSPQEVNGTTASATHPPGTFSSRWVERAVLLDARGTVRAVEFAPHHFGLKVVCIPFYHIICYHTYVQSSQATISTDNHLRIYECLEQPSLQTWSQSEEIDVLNLSSRSSQTSSLSLAFATPTQTSATLDGASATLVAQALQQSQSTAIQGTGPGRPGLGNREADGGWCISWCKERYWGEVIAVGCGTGGIVKVPIVFFLLGPSSRNDAVVVASFQIIQISPSRRPITLLTLDTAPNKEDTTQASHQPPPPMPSLTATDSEITPAYAVTSVSWAPSCGRSYHLIATGSRDGHVRIWKVKPFEEDDVEVEGNWAASIVADFDHHKFVLVLSWFEMIN